MNPDDYLGKFVMWNDKPAQIIGMITDPAVIVKSLDGTGKQAHIVVSSVQYQKEIKPMPTIEGRS